MGAVATRVIVTMASDRTQTTDLTLPFRSVRRPKTGERSAPVTPLAVSRIPTCHRSRSNSLIRYEARTQMALWEKVATPMAVAVTAASENRLKGRTGRIVVDK